MNGRLPERRTVVTKCQQEIFDGHERTQVYTERALTMRGNSSYCGVKTETFITTNFDVDVKRSIPRVSLICGM